MAKAFAVNDGATSHVTTSRLPSQQDGRFALVSRTLEGTFEMLERHDAMRLHAWRCVVLYYAAVTLSCAWVLRIVTLTCAQRDDSSLI